MVAGDNVTQGLAERETAAMPLLVSQAGDAARFAFEEFFHGQIRNPHTRKAYLHALRVFTPTKSSSGQASSSFPVPRPRRTR